MRVQRIEIWRYRVLFRLAFITSAQSLTTREGLILKAETDEGVCGYGEIAPLQRFSRELLDEVVPCAVAAIEPIKGAAIQRDTGELTAMASSVVERLTGRSMPPSLHFGLETLLADFAAKEAELPLARWLSPQAAGSVRVNALLSGGIEDVLRQAAHKHSLGFGTFKLKVGTEQIHDDILKVERVREVLGNDVSLRLDANRAWSDDDSRLFCESVSRCNIEYIEEPLADPTTEALKRLRESTGVRIALDETLTASLVEHGNVSADLSEQLARFAGVVDYVVLKPSAIGGINQVRNIVRLLESYSCLPVVTSMLETGVGVAACLHTAASLGEALPVCGLNTLDLLESSLLTDALPVTDGWMNVPDGNGLGVEPLLENNSDFVERIIR